MRIESHHVAMKAQSKKEETLSIRQERIKEQGPQSLELGHDDPLWDLFDIDIEPVSGKAEGVHKTQSSQLYEISEEDYQKVKLLEKILSYLTGKEVKFTLPKAIQAHDQEVQMPGVQYKEAVGQPYMRRSVEYSRKQSMKFQATGSVKTSDGRTIEFDLKMARHESISFSSEHVVDKNGKVVDPLVIHYDGTLPKLTQNKYAFDLDYDGASDQISFLSSGSGYLAFDKNEDGTINDGRELFGPNSGDGFKDLAKYDQDGNGWIDEGDDIFNKLRVWNKDEEGRDVLFALGEVGVGAIYLGNVATDFALGNGPMADDGFVRSTGIFLKEDGSGAGTVQHIDLTL